MEVLEAAVKNNNLQSVFAALQNLKKQYNNSYYIRNHLICKALEHGNGYVVAALLTAKNLQAAPFHSDSLSECSDDDEESWYYRSDNPLYWSIVVHKSLELTKMLLDAGYEPFPKEQETALQLAAMTEDIDLLQYIWELAKSRNISIDVEDGCCWAPLRVAASRLLTSAIRFLFEQGADANAEDNGLTVFASMMQAEALKEPRNAEKVIKATQLFINFGLRLELSPSSGCAYRDEMTPLMEASHNGISAAIGVLLDAGAKIDARSAARQRSALHFASSFECVRLLLAAGADVTAKDVRGSTPLHAACAKGLDCVPLLLAAGADVNARDVDGNTPLHDACNHRLNAEEMIKQAVLELINHGAGINAKNHAGKTPLHVACESICIDGEGAVGAATIFDVLLEYGADLFISAAGKQSCLHLLVNMVCEKCPSTLPWGDYWLKRSKGPAASALGCIQRLLNAGAKADAINVGGFTPLELIKERLGAAVLNEHKDIFAPIIVALIKGGDFYSWGSVPKGCPGLETAMEAVFENLPEMLPYLLAKLSPDEQERVRMTLRCLQRYLPNESVRVLILSKLGVL